MTRPAPLLSQRITGRAFALAHTIEGSSSALVEKRHHQDLRDHSSARELLRVVLERRSSNLLRSCAQGDAPVDGSNTHKQRGLVLGRFKHTVCGQAPDTQSTHSGALQHSSARVSSVRSSPVVALASAAATAPGVAGAHLREVPRSAHHKPAPRAHSCPQKLLFREEKLRYL